MTYVAIPVQAFTLTGSTLAVGLIGICELVSLLLTAFVGGAMADAWDRRRMVRYAEIGLLGVSGLLLVNASLDRPRVWPLFVLSARGGVRRAAAALARGSLRPARPQGPAAGGRRAAQLHDELRRTGVRRSPGC